MLLPLAPGKLRRNKAARRRDKPFVKHVTDTQEAQHVDHEPQSTSDETLFRPYFIALMTAYAAVCAADDRPTLI